MRYCRLLAPVVSVLVFARPGLVSASTKGSNGTTSDFRVLEHGPPNELQDARSVDKEAQEDRAPYFGTEKAATIVARHVNAMVEAFDAAKRGTQTLTAAEDLEHFRTVIGSMRTSSERMQHVDHGYPSDKHSKLAEMMFSRPSFLKKRSLKTGEMTTEEVNNMYEEYKKIIPNDRDLAVLIQLAKEFGTAPAKRNAESMEKVQFEAWAKANVAPQDGPLKWDPAHSALHGRDAEVKKVQQAYAKHRPAK
ncbi:unnamed protein product [Hyaloperonospora brassicae]|uniref:RxLR effector candidate protein n=1 Tax=Hyaloperonospora brassicae TaxID=162125 RepID=A0AAV0TJY3_HYABA|nr:unnamed protein product [Hyaloperonospora brassicae]